MHEYSIAYDIYTTARRAAQENKANLVKRIHVDIGEMALVNPEQVEFLFSAISEDDPLFKGVEITYRQVLNTLEKFGVKPISPVGELFDPEKHEAVMLQPSDQEPNRVLSETQRGYLFLDRLLRPAKVIVAKPEEKGS